MAEETVIDCLPHQVDFIESDARYLLNSGGVGSGKTYSLVLRALHLMAKHPGIKGMIAGPTLTQLRETTMEVFQEMCPPGWIKTFNKSRNLFTVKNRSSLIFKSMENPLALKSFTLGFGGIEEMSDTKEESFKMLRSRMRQPGMPGCIFGATNPGTFGNYVYKNFIERPIPGSTVIYSATNQNSYLPAEYLADLETFRLTNPDYYRRMVEGIWGAMEGLIYNLPLSQRVTTPDKLHKDFPAYVKGFDRILAGLDFGFTHPTGIAIAGQTGRKFTIFDEVYRRNMSAADVVDLVASLHAQYRFSHVYCDNARPEIIEDLRKRHVPALPCLKGEDSVFLGIMHVISMINSGELEISQSCGFTLREMDSYIWDPNNTKREVPIKANDHLLDAIRYMLHTEAKRPVFKFVSIGPDGLRK